MAQFTFETTGSCKESFQYHKKRSNDPFYRKQPYFRFSEEVAGQLYIERLDMNERVVLGQSLTAGQGVDCFGSMFTKRGCIKPSDEELVVALEAIEIGSPLRLEATASRSKDYTATSRRSVPSRLDIPDFSLKSIAGNLRDLRAKKIKAIKKLQSDAKKTDGISAEDTGRMLLVHASVAGKLIAGIETEVADVAQTVFGITEPVLRQKLADSIG